jgi:hypothetical protein
VLASTDVQLPLSTNTLLDLPTAQERFRLREDALSHVDVVLR